MKSSRALFFAFLSGLSMSLLLTACGLKGPLYLPKDEPQAKNETAVVTPAPTTKSQSVTKAQASSNQSPAEPKTDKQ